MPFDEGLAARVRKLLSGRDDVVEKQMFGGLAFMVRGYMACGIVRDDLMVKVGPDLHASALQRPYARPMDFTGRPSKGMVYVGPGGTRGASLKKWIALATTHAESRPKK
jgi:TfoX/Sxy family transcriptional regulator of competence genes